MAKDTPKPISVSGDLQKALFPKSSASEKKDRR